MSDLENVTTFDRALKQYAEAVRATAFWQEHGSRGDGNLDAAKAAEKAARQLVKRKGMGS